MELVLLRGFGSTTPIVCAEVDGNGSEGKAAEVRSKSKGNAGEATLTEVGVVL